MPTSDAISDGMRRTVELLRQPPPDLIIPDRSACLPSWLETFAKAYDKGEAVTLSANAAAALYHTLLAAKLRTEKLIQERDTARAQATPVQGL